MAYPVGGGIVVAAIVLVSRGPAPRQGPAPHESDGRHHRRSASVGVTKLDALTVLKRAAAVVARRVDPMQQLEQALGRGSRPGAGSHAMVTAVLRVQPSPAC